MIAANQVAAMHAARHELAVPFRYQRPPHEVDPTLVLEGILGASRS